MTQTAQPLGSGLEPVMTEPAPRRRFLGRLSLGHLVMVLAGLIAFLLVLAVLRDNSATTYVARTVVDIPAGTTITSADLELIEVAGDSLAGIVLTADEVNAIITEGRVTARALASGSILQAADFGSAGSPAGTRSMSIPVSPGNAVAGTLKPGDRVDVIGTDAEETWYVATGVEVLAVAGSTGGGFASGNDYTITIGVDPVIGLRLACGIENYRINVVRATGATPLQLPPAPESCA